jgi:fumarylacetoacetase
MPVSVGDFTDFSCSSDHVQNASEAIFGTRSTPPAFYNFPVGYAGRCSSLDISGTPVERPMGQHWVGKPGSEVKFGPSQRMDFELELACVIGKPLARRERVLASKAKDHIFGYCLINDWSARDIQALEMNPLGPLNGKNAATTVSPWIITPEALQPFQAEIPAREQAVTSYLDHNGGSYNIQLQVEVSQQGEEKGSVVCSSNASWMYWTLAQCVAHQAIGGCGLRTGDLLATGTVSGRGETEHGCLMEHMKAGSTPPRGYLEDNETVTLSGYCGEGVGFGECAATLVSAKPL